MEGTMLFNHPLSTNLAYNLRPMYSVLIGKTPNTDFIIGNCVTIFRQGMTDIYIGTLGNYEFVLERITTPSNIPKELLKVDRLTITNSSTNSVLFNEEH